VTFFRQIAFLLPSAFLLGVLLFLVTHGRNDPGFGTYPFFQEWAGESLLASTAEARFVEQSALFFVPVYLLALLFVLCVTVAESALFGRRAERRTPSYRRSFAAVFSVLFLLTSGALVVAGDRLAARYTPGAIVAPLLVAFAPFGAAALAVAPAAILAVPLAALRRAGDA
jgi:hypothetical protein